MLDFLLLKTDSNTGVFLGNLRTFDKHLLLKIMNSSSYLRVLSIVPKIVSAILLQELIKYFAVCKHCSGTLVLVEGVTSSQFCKLELPISKRSQTF